jgi:hypothetical protein
MGWERGDRVVPDDDEARFEAEMADSEKTNSKTGTRQTASKTGQGREKTSGWITERGRMVGVGLGTSCTSERENLALIPC